MKLWLLDADVIIDLLSLGIFDKLAKAHKAFAASTVISEVRYYEKGPHKYPIDFKKEYVVKKLISEATATLEEIKGIICQLPPLQRESIDSGELESLAILSREKDLIFCSCDAAAIRALPFLGLSERGISVEHLLRLSGLLKPGLNERHMEFYFKGNLMIGKQNRIFSFDSKKGK